MVYNASDARVHTDKYADTLMSRRPKISADHSALLDAVDWHDNGLIAAVAQDWKNLQVLMLAWMNREALEQTLSSGQAVYWSRSRNQLWRKGESSGCTQKVREIRLDCDGDAIVLHVEQLGSGACHTGRYSCFYRRRDGERWRLDDAAAPST